MPEKNLICPSWMLDWYRRKTGTGWQKKMCEIFFSHTDSRGNAQYNQWLSQKRANSAVQYMLDRGIERSRIKAKGYGETMLLSKCADGVKCTEVAHQLNRRTEFKNLK